MGKGSGSSRTQSPNNGGQTIQPTTEYKVPMSVAETKGLSKSESAKALDAVTKYLETATGEMAGNALTVKGSLMKRNMLMDMLGSDADSNISTIDNVKLQKIGHSQLEALDMITDGTSVYVVDKVSKGGTVTASRTIYEKSGITGLVMTKTDKVKFQANDTLYYVGGSGASEYNSALEARRYKIATGKN